MKIAGTFFDITLQIKNSTTNVIELCISEKNEIVYHVDVMDFSEVRLDLLDFFKAQNITLPVNRLDALLNELEGQYEEIHDNLQKKVSAQLARQKATTKQLSSSSNQSSVQKFLLLGLSGVGKSSIYEVLFNGKFPHETRNLPATRGIQRYDVISHSGVSEALQPKERHSLANKAEFIIWELGGQMQFLDRYFQEPEQVFSDATCLIFVIDAFDVNCYEQARETLHTAIRDIEAFGKKPAHLTASQSNIFIFIHKMDEFQNRDEKFNSLVEYFSIDPKTDQARTDINFYNTSIYDSSIYGAWAKVTRTILPKSAKLNMVAQELKDELNLWAVIVIERRTGLPICTSKMLYDDTVLVGDVDRLLITIDNFLGDFNLTKIGNVKIDTANGVLDVRIFNQYFILVLMYPATLNVCDPDTEVKISAFIETMKKNI